MPKFRFQIVERRLMEVDAPSAEELFFNYPEYEEQAELVDVDQVTEPENIQEVKAPAMKVVHRDVDAVVVEPKNPSVRLNLAEVARLRAALTAKMPDPWISRYVEESFPCATCDARPGERCRTASGGLAGSSHLPRKRAENDAWHAACDGGGSTESTAVDRTSDALAEQTEKLADLRAEVARLRAALTAARAAALDLTTISEDLEAELSSAGHPEERVVAIIDAALEGRPGVIC